LFCAVSTTDSCFEDFSVPTDAMLGEAGQVAVKKMPMAEGSTPTPKALMIRTTAYPPVNVYIAMENHYF